MDPASVRFPHFHRCAVRALRERVAISAARAFEFQIEFHKLMAFIVDGPCARVVEKVGDFVRVMRVAIGKHGGVRQPHHGDAEDLRERPRYVKARIAEMLHVISRVVVGVISAVAAVKIILHR